MGPGAVGDVVIRPIELRDIDGEYDDVHLMGMLL
jgi:hypothetical protein